MVTVKAKFPQWWRNNKYDKDQEMPANKEQARRLTKAGVAYYSVEKVEVTNKDSEEVETLEVAPTMANTKKEIEEYLDDNGIEYDEYATKTELLELIDG